MRVYFYLADITFTGGIEKITTTLSNYFVGHGIDVIIVSNFRTNKEFSYPLDSRVKTEFLTEIPYSGKPGSFKRLKMFFDNKNRVKSFFSALHNEMIIVQTFPNSFLYWLCMGKKNHNRIINVEHVHYFYYKLFIRTLRYFVYKTYNNVCVLTNADKRQYDKLKINATCIPNATDLKKIIALNAFNLRRKTILGVGRLEEQKNFQALIQVFVRVHEKHPEWNLEIYGGGTLKTALQHQIDEAHITDCAKLMGVSNNISEVFQSSGFFVLSSLFEGFPMVICEAMANGCPVVSYACPNGPSDLIKDGENGLLVENQNEEKLYEAICKMIKSEELREHCSRNALVSVKKYSIENVFSQWKFLFEKCEVQK